MLRGLVVALLVLASTAAAAPESEPPLVVGHSVRGRPIVAYELGDPTAPATLVVGVIHGSEPAGLRVIAQLRHMPLPPNVHLWLVPTANPDGLAAGKRQNAHGVDLNRNWPVGWRHNGVPWDGYYSGPRPMSEPENRAMRAFILQIKPALTIWYHQNYGWVGGSGASMTPARQYQALTGLGTLKRSGDCAKGFMWCPIDDALGSSSILVELPDVLTPADVQIHSLALLAVASKDSP